MYAFKQVQEANYQLAIDYIAEVFAPDMMTLEPQDRNQLETYRKQAVILYEERVKGTPTAEKGAELPIQVTKAAVDAVNMRSNNNRKDLANMANVMVTEVDRIADSYLLLLQLCVSLYDIIDKEFATKWRATERVNVIVEMLRANNQVKLAIVSKTQQDDLLETLNHLFVDVVKKDHEVEAYFKNSDTTFEQDREFITYLYKSYLWQHPMVVDFFEEFDLAWSENKTTVKSLFNKTLKQVTIETIPKDILVTLSPNWEDDRKFLVDLFKHCAEQDEKYDKIIGAKLENWDLERVNLMDQMILKMALAEMVHFPAIPVKVTINEYIDISKVYSTPKSKQFVNGVLDKLSAEFIESGLIKKSGRGLLDTK